MILLHQIRTFFPDGKMLELLAKHLHVQRTLPKLVNVFLDMLREEKYGVHRSKIELPQILVCEVGMCKNNGGKILRRVINLVSPVEEIESELVAGERPLLVCDHRNGQSCNERCDWREIGWFHKVLIFLQNDERMHHYQRERASLTGLMVELREIIETGRLVVVVMTRLVRLLHLFACLRPLAASQISPESFAPKACRLNLDWLRVVMASVSSA
jgi:hypothetical protein